MKSKVLGSFAEAVADIPNGASIFLAGFGPGTPWNLMKALYEQGARELTLIANSAGGATANNADGGSTDIVGYSTLIEGRRARKVILAFTAGTHPSRPTPLESLHEAGEIEAELNPQGTLAERIRAAGAGIPAFYTPAAVGTELAEGKEHRVFNGRTYILEEALPADYAFIRAWKADEFGNLVYRRAQRNFNPLMAAAATTTIVEAEQVVPVGEIDPDHVHTPGIFVDRIILIPPPPEGILHVQRA